MLLSEARANHAVIGDHLTLGVRNFAWLGPGEARGSESGAAWPHGAFIYLYDESRPELDCFFALKESVRSDVSRTMGAMGASMSFRSPDMRGTIAVNSWRGGGVSKIRN